MMSTVAHVWRVLDLSGMTTSPRQSSNYVKSNYVFLNGNQVTMNTTVTLGSLFDLSIHFPNGREYTKQMILVPQYQAYPQDVTRI